MLKLLATLVKNNYILILSSKMCPHYYYYQLTKIKTGLVTYFYDPKTQETEAEKFLEVTWDYTAKPYLKL